MICSYARVSTGGQDRTRQLAAWKAAGCENAFCAKLMGAPADRPKVQRPLRRVTQGDAGLEPDLKFG